MTSHYEFPPVAHTPGSLERVASSCLSAIAFNQCKPTSKPRAHVLPKEHRGSAGFIKGVAFSCYALYQQQPEWIVDCEKQARTKNQAFAVLEEALRLVISMTKR
jgi:hypothetical protein